MLRIDHALVRMPGAPTAIDEPLDAAAIEGRVLAPPVSGTVYGVLANYRGFLEALGESVHAPPYKAPPKAPVLFVKPRNTVIGSGMPVPVPDGVDSLEMGACLGLVIGRTACRVSEASAIDCVAGYTVVNDVSVPHTSYFRPAIRHKCRDGFCPIGPRVVASRLVPDPGRLAIRVLIDGREVQTATTGDLLRPIPRLLADVTEFMTLTPGDVLLVGTPPGAPTARAGQRVTIEIDGIGRLENPLVAEADLAKAAA